MLLSLFKSIRELTDSANTLIKESKIEQCYIALIERQKLLEKLHEQVSHTSESNPQSKENFIELLRWIQQQDQPNVIELESKKQQNIKESIKQVQTNKAIQQYKNV